MAAPMVVIIALSALIVLQFRDDATTARRQVTVSKGLPYLADVAVLLQQERSLSTAYILAPSEEGLYGLKQLRGSTDRAFTELRAHFGTASLGEVAPDAAITANALANNGFKALTVMRAKVDKQAVSINGMRTVYNALVGSVISVPSLLAQSLGDPVLARSLRAYQALLQVEEYGVLERDLLNGVYLTRKVTREQFEQHTAVLGGVDNTLTSLVPLIRDDFAGQQAVVNAALSPASLEPYRKGLAAASTSGKVDASLLGAWNKTAGLRIDRLVEASRLVSGQIGRNTNANADATERTEYLVIAIAIGALLLIIAVTVFLGRRITAPLRRLTDVARDMSAKLPTMVEQMQRPGDRPDLQVEPIVVRTRDEVGKLAEAFNAVNEVTVRVAGEQAALRGSIAEMFTNMARRNQVLLDRQLAFLDRLEAREEDPDTLENLFRLDHLATRMRRNSESLLVLAGIDAARKLRQPMPLSDVIRAAIGGIEAYDRVDLSVSDDAEISGRVAMSLSHLFAELLENATHFSNPDTRVWVTASAVTDGVLVVVRDQGLGMTDDELVEANLRIENPPVTELAVAQRLGFFVVGRLAQRLGAQVHLGHGARGGVVAEIQLPISLFQGAALPFTPDTAEEFDGTPALPPATGTLTGDTVAGTQEPVTVVPDDVQLPIRGRAPVAPASDGPVPEETYPVAGPIPSLPVREVTSPAPVASAPVPPVIPVEPVRLVPPVVPAPLDVPVPRAAPVPPVAPVPVEPAPVAQAPIAPVPMPAQRTPVSPAAGGAVGRAAVTPAPEVAPAPEIAPFPEPEFELDPLPLPPAPVAARTILPSRERGLLRRRTVAPAEPVALPLPPRHSVPPVVRPAGLPQHSVPPIPAAPMAPAPAPIRMPAPPVQPAPVRSAPAPAPVALPNRGPRHEAPVPASVEAVSELSPLAQLSQLASASYTPQLMTPTETAPPAQRSQPEPQSPDLVRRQPAAMPVGNVEDDEQPIRPRAAGDVRSMLSGFRAGVQRGRDGAHTNRPGHGVDNLRRD
ncbi:MAG TPA: nitrate- and nitrite sensing domain-containing protein [Mycobacteriales bacterium]